VENYTISVEDLKAVYENIFDSSIGNITVTSLKVICVFIVIIVALRDYLNIAKPPAEREKEVTYGLQPYQLLRYILFIVLISAFDYLLLFAESILSYVEGSVKTPVYEHIAWNDYTTPKEETENELLEQIFKYIKDPSSIITDSVESANHFIMTIVLSIGEFILLIIDKILYGVFLADRYFMLCLLHICFPLVVVLSVVDQYKDLVYRFFKLLAAVYMLVPALYFVNYFGTQTYVSLAKLWFDKSPLGMGSSLITVMLLFFVIWIKFRLFKRVFDFTFKIFS